MQFNKIQEIIHFVLICADKIILEILNPPTHNHLMAKLDMAKNDKISCQATAHHASTSAYFYNILGRQNLKILLTYDCLS